MKSNFQTAAKIFKKAPKELGLEGIVNYVFETGEKCEILLILNIIFRAHPSFRLSPYNSIRKTILEDEDHLLTNHSLLAMLKEQGLDSDKDKVQGCYEIAYRLNHPYIYPLSPISVPASDYTLNFLWVNLNPQDRIQDTAQNIFNDELDFSENAEWILHPESLRALEKTEHSQESWKRIQKNCIYRIAKWANANPDVQINLWYDSALVTRKAQQKTLEMMKGISKSKNVALRLRDIRFLPNIKGEIENSFHPGTPLFYRVDIIKALIGDYMISSPQENAKYCVFCDMDIEPMTSQQIFDQRTLDYLSSNGYVFNRVYYCGWLCFENSFFIFNKEKTDLQKNHHKMIIQKMALHITSLRKYPIKKHINIDDRISYKNVFNLYPNFLKKMQEKRNKLTIPRKAVKCPESQFNCGGNFSDGDFQREAFRFVGSSSTIPYTINGRNVHKGKEAPIDALKTWKAEPLLD